MITCEQFQSRFAANAQDGSVLEHLRACDACLDFAAHLDPDVMFRAIGGVEIEPPGGVDAFVDDVMAQVRVRTTESTMRPVQHFNWRRQLALAATLAIAFAGSLFVYRSNTPLPVSPVRRAVLIAQATPQALSNVATVESYDSQSATILELPTEKTDDVKIVMIFDENLPVDL